MGADSFVASAAWRQAGREIRRASLRADTLTIGRAYDNDLVIAVDAVSKHHLRLERVPRGWQARDLDSSNGTMLNGLPLRDCSLVMAGDVLSLAGEKVVLLGAAEASPRRRSSRVTVRIGAAACALLLAAMLFARAPDPGNRDTGQRAMAAPPSAEPQPSGAVAPQVIEEIKARADSASVDVTTAWLQEAQRARWVGRLGEAARLTRAALDREPESRAARLLSRRIDGERRVRAAQLQRDAALAGAVRDDTAAAIHLTELVDLLEPGDPARAQFAAALERLRQSAARTAHPEARR